MRYYFAVFVVNLVINLCNCEVKFIQSVIRHADRNPISGRLVDFFWPNDEFKNSDWPPDGPMELTNIGKRNAYNLGKYFRERYGYLFGEVYKRDTVFFEAVRMSRTISTAQLIAAGIFPPVESEIWNSKLLWTPVPIHSTAITEDPTFMALAMCKNYQIDRSNADKDAITLLNMLSDVQEFYNYLSIHTGVNYTSPVQSFVLYHQLSSHVSLGTTLEPWTTGIFPDGKLKDIIGVAYVIESYTKRMKRLSGGVWIKKFLNRTEILQNNGKLEKASFHVGNELQIAATLNTLGVYRAHMPGYTSALIFELHEINKDYYVKILYKNEGKLLEIRIPGCETLCPVPKFRDLLKEVTLENFEEDCGEKPESLPQIYEDTLGIK